MLACAGGPSLAANSAQAGDGPAESAGRDGRLVLLAFDGADAGLVRARMEGGALPNLARLTAAGGWSPLESPPPADPVASWVALVTGRDAGQSGVFGSMRVEFGRGQAVPRAGDIQREWRPTEQYAQNPYPVWDVTLLMALGGVTSAFGFLFVLRILLRLGRRISWLVAVLMGAVGGFAGWTIRGYLPDSIPRVASPVLASPFWSTLESEGLRGVVLGAPFDVRNVEQAPSGEGAPVRVLAGRGFPDARGERGTWFLYTSSAEVDAPEPRGRARGASGTVFSVREVKGRATARLYGPDNFAGGKLTGRAERVSVPLMVERDATGVDLTIGNTTQHLEVGDWSQFFPVTFQLNPLLRVNALARARLAVLDEQHFELLVEPLHIDARSAPFWQSPCRPSEFGATLADGVGGPFASCGFLSPDHGLWGEEALVSRAELSFESRLAQLRYALAGNDEDFVAAFFGTPGDVASVVAEKDTRHAVAYARMDEVVGEVLGLLRPADVLIVCSDRGGRPVERTWHLNNWLLEQGWLHARSGAGRGDARVLRFVDWTRTRAFAVGPGEIWLPRAEGVVLDPDERAELLERLEAELRAARDPASGRTPVLSVTRREDLYTGPHADGGPDLVVGLAPEFAFSGETWAGGLALEEEPSKTPVAAFANARASAPPIGVDPRHAAGFFAANRPLGSKEGSASVLDLVPTLFQALGVEAPDGLSTGFLLAPLETEDS